MPTIGILIVALGLFLGVYNLIYAIQGRRLNRAIAISQCFAGFFAAGMYLVFLYDQYVDNILAAEAIRAYCMRPITIVLLSTILATSLRMRWHDHDLD